jgi:hypothetical protein
MSTRQHTRTIAAAVAAGGLVAMVAAVSAVGQSPAAPTVSVAASGVVAADSVPAYQDIENANARSIPRGKWVDIASYRTPTGGPVTHNMSLQLDIKDASGSRPYYVKVSWVRDKGSGWDRTGSQVYAVPTKFGDNPFYVTHEHTIAGVDGLNKAQIYIPGSGSVTMRWSSVQAIAFPDY